MKFNFFTFGGPQLWEDVFFYQKWRIQRHYRSKRYRLLDNWDIQRASGGFEDCRKAFVRFIDAYEIPRQKGELVILLHGMGETKSIFRPLWRHFTQKGYNVAAINYPSSKKPMRHLVKQLEFFLTHCEDVSKVSFITKGAGCLLLRSLLTNSYGWQDKFRLNKVINVNPINCGSDVFELMSRFKIFNWIFGPMLEECTPHKAKYISKISSEVSVGIVFVETLLSPLVNFITDKFQGFVLKNEETEKSFAKHIIKIKNNKLNIFNNPQTIEMCEKFIKDGYFE